MNRILFDHSLKNIGLPSQDAYKAKLIDKVENVVNRMRWKAHFLLNGPAFGENCKYGFKSKKSAPACSEMKSFEESLVRMIEKIEFRKVDDEFLSTLDNDLRKIKSTPNVFVFADKTRNIYETTPENYNKILKENITKTYKQGEADTVDEINSELNEIATKISINDRIETMAKREAFFTIKDHKEDFENNPKYRLLNPAKSELGKVSKIILDQINNKIRETTGVHQWRNSDSVIEWFKNIKDKSKHSFVSFDIAEFYPSITEDLLDKAVSWAKSITPVPEEHVTIIKHARKSLLFNHGDPWVKRNQSLFDVTMGSYDGAEVCDLIGLFILTELEKLFGKDFIGLYRDDGLALLKRTSGHIGDQARKVLCKVFEKIRFKDHSQGVLSKSRLSRCNIKFVRRQLSTIPETKQRAIVH